MPLSHLQKLLTITSDYTVSTDMPAILLVDCTDGNIDITLPAASSAEGLMINVKRLDNSVNTITVAATDSGTIDGAASQSIASQYTSYTFIADSSSGNWFIV